VTFVKNTTTDALPVVQGDGQTGSGAPQFVQGMGLFSATAIVMGSMIGSGIFIVSADMSRAWGRRRC
jgi:APA family basic amino acid/polyamine antiporter